MTEHHHTALTDPYDAAVEAAHAIVPAIMAQDVINGTSTGTHNELTARVKQDVLELIDGYRSEHLSRRRI
jgi:hypothetical protein